MLHKCHTSAIISGYPLIVADTAGLRESADIVEQEGVRRARSRYTDVCTVSIHHPPPPHHHHPHHHHPHHHHHHWQCLSLTQV
jgi:tRNA U34 5-carboxymethylaminomethyl modifying GTPase MnmE/TrmE